MTAICPNCGKENVVAGMHDRGKLCGEEKTPLWCGFCKKRFPATPEKKEEPKLTVRKT